MKNKRLSFRLLIGLSLTALCVWCIATAVALDSCKKEVKDVFNAQQVLFAERLAASDLKNVLLDENANFPRGGFKPQNVITIMMHWPLPYFLTKVKDY